MIFPSSDLLGFELSVPGEVRRTGSPPSAPTSQISECRLLADSLTVVTVKAICLPSGERAGELTVVTRYQSAGVKARPLCPSCPTSGAAEVTARMAIANDTRNGRISSTPEFGGLYRG